MILFFGPMFSEDILLNYPATSPAASLWCKNFVINLNKFNDVKCISYVNNSLFPKGRLFINEYTFENPIPIKLVSYISLPLLREKTIINKSINEIKKINNESKIDFIITYNTTVINLNIGRYCKKRGIKWISIYADADTDKQLVSNADYHIYFSYSSYIRSIYKNKICFEGACYDKVPNNYINNNNKIFLYTGVIRKENGLDLIIDAFAKIKDNDAVLKICGKGMYEGFINKIKKDKRIIYLGLVNDSELKMLYNEASYFLNPRLSCYEENNNNFPSKLLDYLSYGKPIITTKTKGINPIYFDYMFVLEKETIEECHDLMFYLLNMDDFKKIEIFNKIKLFSNHINTWDLRVENLVNQIRESNYKNNDLF